MVKRICRSCLMVCLLAICTVRAQAGITALSFVPDPSHGVFTASLTFVNDVCNGGARTWTSATVDIWENDFFELSPPILAGQDVRAGGAVGAGSSELFNFTGTLVPSVYLVPTYSATASVSYTCEDGSGGTIYSPEPSTIVLLASGILLGLAGVLRCKLRVYM